MTFYHMKTTWKKDFCIIHHPGLEKNAIKIGKISDFGPTKTSDPPPSLKTEDSSYLAYDLQAV